MFKNKIFRIVFCVLIFLFILGSNTVYAADFNEWPLSVRVNNELIEFPDAKPFIDCYGRTQVPIRFIAEALGAKVEMIPGTTTVIVNKGDKDIILKIGFEEMVVNGVVKVMDCSPIIRDSRTFVPVRFVAEELDVLVDWDNETNTVFITSPENENLKLSKGVYNVAGFEIELDTHDYGEQRTSDIIWMQTKKGLIINQTGKDLVEFRVVYYGTELVERYHNYEKQVKELEGILLQKLSKETVSRIINKIMECRLEFGEEVFFDNAEFVVENFVEGEYLVKTVFGEKSYCSVEFLPLNVYGNLVEN